ncbi:MAG: imidazole glycerol phosphate synthase subunit HisH [Planctomycetes bacterium]|nr:imidazole glycerol phosphate synthase subunit HisH [Planctomycetota bacterium]
MIGIVDYGVGNLRSVQKALEQLDARAAILAGPDQLRGIDRLILPGVGAYGDGMAMLRQRGWVAPVLDFIRTGKPFLGICLGLQLLFDGSEEDAPANGPLVPGLAALPGAVVRFREEQATPRLKVPHMGWNTLTWQRDDPLLRGLNQGDAVYFVHSYYARPVESAARPVASAMCDYGGPFCASLWRDNVWATQFHPEKSQRVGLKILANFAAV